MAIDGIKYSYSFTDTSVDVSYSEDGAEEVITVDTVLSDAVVDIEATEQAIKTAVYGSESPPDVIPAQSTTPTEP